MAAPEPLAKNLADLYDLAPLDWAEVRHTLETHLTQAPGTGGPDHHTFWLSTTDADGPPHMTAVGAFWVEGRYYFCGSPRSRKIRYIERDPRSRLRRRRPRLRRGARGPCHPRHRRHARLQRLAAVFAEGGWAPTVAGGGFTHDYSAPSAGPPPWYVYEFIPAECLRRRHHRARRRHPLDLRIIPAGECGTSSNRVQEYARPQRPRRSHRPSHRRHHRRVNRPDLPERRRLRGRRVEQPA